MVITILAAIVSIVYHVLIMNQASSIKDMAYQINILSIPANSWVVVISKEVQHYLS
jgi:uncharacterized membrane protein